MNPLTPIFNVENLFREYSTSVPENTEKTTHSHRSISWLPSSKC